MTSVLRALLKRLLRIHPHPILDAEVQLHGRQQRTAAAYDRVICGSFLLRDEEFVRARFKEANRMRAAVEAVAGKEWLGRARGLDVGAGNGAFELAMATAGYFIVGVEPLWNETVLACAKEADLPLRRVVARACPRSS